MSLSERIRLDALNRSRQTGQGAPAKPVRCSESRQTGQEFHGRVKDGVVVFEDGAPPEGVEVRVEIVSAADESPSIWDKLKK